MNIYKYNYSSEKLKPGKPCQVKVSKDLKYLIVISKNSFFPRAKFIPFTSIKGLLFGAVSSTFSTYNQDLMKSLHKENMLHLLKIDEFLDWKM